MSNSQPCAIVVLYNGRKMSDDQFANLAAMIAESLRSMNITIPELTVAKFLDSSDLAKVLSEDTVRVEGVKIKKNIVKDDPVENALKYISTRYEAQIHDTNTTKLVLELSKDIRGIMYNKTRGKEWDVALENALNIVCVEHTVYAPQLAKYGITDRTMNAIRDCYSFYTIAS